MSGRFKESRSAVGGLTRLSEEEALVPAAMEPVEEVVTGGEVADASIEELDFKVEEVFI